MNKLTLDGVSRLWLGTQKGVALTRLFRRRFKATAGQTAAIALYADTTYRLWCNGAHVGRGPVYHHPHRRPVERYDLTPYLREGDNIVAVLVYVCGFHTDHSVHTGTPGLIARLRVGDCVLDTDTDWRVTARTGWSDDVPRRTESIGHVEAFDANVAPFGWTDTDFDDSEWSPAELYSPFASCTDGIYHVTGLPRMRHTFAAAKPLSLHTAMGEAPPLHANLSCGAFAEALDREPWGPPASVRHNGEMALHGLDGREAAAWVLDLGAEYTGTVTFEFESDSGGTIDVGWSEVIEDGRPPMCRKGGSYADRYIARPGANRWLGHSYSGGRYIVLVMRGFAGAVRFKRVGMLASQIDLNWGGRFECSDEQINAVWRMCERTVRVGIPGEGLVDCPTREQSPYVGDANLVANWIGRLTGDYAHWRYIVRETFASQGRSGLVKTIIFSGIGHVLLDYELLAVIGARDYLRVTGDRDTIHGILPAAERLLAWFDGHIAGDGLLDFAWENRPLALEYNNNIDDAPWNLFIDHCGMGWHNQGEPGVDRRGRNAAINALLAISWDAMAEMTGDAAWTRRADHMRRMIVERFWHRRRQVFVDGWRQGRRLEQVSQQTNTWCVLANCVDDDTARSLMLRLLDSDDTTLARSGPYFWHYMIDLLTRLDLHAIALDHVRQLWFDMIRRGATTTFETFAGDKMDSLCHPWSCKPVEFLPRHIVGIGTPHEGAVQLRPRVDLLAWAEATVVSPAGPITLGWNDEGVHVSLPEDMRGHLYILGRVPVEIAGTHRSTWQGSRREAVTAKKDHQ